MNQAAEAWFCSSQLIPLTSLYMQCNSPLKITFQLSRMAVNSLQMLMIQGWFGTTALLADNHVAKGFIRLQFFSPHSSARISESCSCTRLVSTYIVALFQCFRMVPVSCSSGGANKNVHQKTAPLSNEVRLKHP